MHTQLKMPPTGARVHTPRVRYRHVGWVIALLLASATTLSAQQVEEDPIKSTRAMIQEYNENQRIISKEKTEQKKSEQLLRQQIELVQHQLEKIREDTGEKRKEVAQAQKEWDELQAENEKLKQATAGLEAGIRKLEERTLAALRAMPEHVRSQRGVETASQQIPVDAEAGEKKDLARRFLAVTGTLRELHISNRQITLLSEQREHRDGKKAEVTTMYIGLGQAWYVNAQGTFAGVGRPAGDGWDWAVRDGIAKQVAEAIAVHRGEVPARFVHIPLKVVSKQPAVAGGSDVSATRSATEENEDQ